MPLLLPPVLSAQTAASLISVLRSGSGHLASGHPWILLLLYSVSLNIFPRTTYVLGRARLAEVQLLSFLCHSSLRGGRVS